MPSLRTLRAYVVVGLLNASEGMFTMLVPPYLNSLGFAPTAVGALVSAFGVAALASRLPAGALYRGHRARRLLYGALLAMVLTGVFYPLATESWSLLLVRTLHGLAYGLGTTINFALFIDTLPPQASRHHAVGYFTATLSAGFTIGQAFAGFAADWYGYTWACLLAALAPLLALACVDAPSTGAGAASPREPAAPVDLRARLLAPLLALGAPGILPMALVAFFLAFFLHVSSTFFPLYALAIGLGLAEIGVVKSFHSVCNTLTRPFTGGFIQRVGRARIAAGTLALNALLLFLIPSLTTIVALSALMIVLGLVRGVGMVANAISVASDIDESHVSRGLASGIYYGSRDLGMILGPIAAGSVAGLVGIEGMFRILPPLGLVAYFVGVAASARYASGRAPAPARGH